MKTYVWTEYECPYGGTIVACVRLDAESVWERLRMALYILRNGFIGSVHPDARSAPPQNSPQTEKGEPPDSEN